jgi:hypothetical protein
MPVTATDPFAEHFVGVRALFAASPAFQDMTNAATEADAMLKVYDQYAPKEARRPFAIIIDMPAQAKRGAFWSSTARVVIEREIPFAYVESPLDAETEFRNVIGAIMTEIQDLSYDGGRMPLRSPVTCAGIVRSAPEKETGRSYYTAMISLEPGVR